MKFAHIGCGEVVAEYIGDREFTKGIVMYSNEWLVFDDKVKPGEVMRYTCPKCHAPFELAGWCLEEKKE